MKNAEIRRNAYGNLIFEVKLSRCILQEYISKSAIPVVHLARVLSLTCASANPNPKAWKGSKGPDRASEERVASWMEYKRHPRSQGALSCDN